MTLFLAWIVCPFVLAVAALGCGLLLEAAAGTALPGSLVVPAGLAVMIVTGVLTTFDSETARLTTPAVLALAAAGFVLSARRPRRFSGWAAACAVAVFAVYAAPVVMSGAATFAGYVKLDDTATWLAITDQIMDHGRSTGGLGPSSYQETVHFYLTTSGYPVGSLVPLGIAHTIVGQDVAWLFQPVISFFAALLALSVYGIVEPVVRSRPSRALVAFVAAQPALLYGYALWDGVKEVVSSVLVVCLAALVPPLLRSGVRVRGLLPAAVVSAAVIGSLSAGGAVWLIPVLLPPACLAAARLRHRLTRAVLLRAGGLSALAVALAIPSLVIATPFLHETTLTKKTELNVLFHPLSFLQLFGVWPNGDFRLEPDRRSATYVLVAIVIAAGAVGVAVALRRRAFGLPIYVCGALVASAAVVIAGSPWVGGKALATASPAFLASALALAALVYTGGRRIEAVALGALIAGGVLWSNALAYRDVWLAPRGQLAELQRIGNAFAGEGPALITEYTPNGDRHFLRRLDAESSSDLRYRPIPLRNGTLVPKGGYADIDSFRLDAILVYRTLVLGRSPIASRPPSDYRLAWSGRYYEVWQRATFRPILRHVPLGTATQTVAVPPCSVVTRLAAIAGREGAVLATVRRPPVAILPLTETAFPSGWGSDASGLYPTSEGTIEGTIALPRDGLYHLWIGGSWASGMRAFVDGRAAGSARHRIDHPGQFTPFGTLRLTAGVHRIVLEYAGPDWRPGSDASLGPTGPLVLGTTDAAVPVTYVRPADARSLCGKSLDWIEIVR
jgi:hypothetical protein